MLEFLEASYAGKILATLLMSMVPIVELREAIPFGAALGLPPAAVMGAAIIGNMIPVPFIILFIKKIFQWMRRFEPLAKLVSHFESKAESKSDRVTRYKKFGLCIFVAVPLPGPALGWSSHRRAAGYETEGFVSCHHAGGLYRQSGRNGDNLWIYFSFLMK